MGYTHYWYQRADVPPETWELIRADVRQLLLATEVPLAYEQDMPMRPPEIGDTLIRFNGVGADGFETFLLIRDIAGRRLRRGETFDFTKTNRRNYDGMVCAVLAIAAGHAPQCYRIASDGDADDWAAPLSWASTILGRAVALPFKPEFETG